MLRIHIASFPETDGFGFYFLRYEGDRKFIARIDKDGNTNWKELDGSNKVIKPTFFIGGMLEREFLEVLAEALDKKNIKTDKDAKIQGTLEAQKYHLEDLRKLLKLDNI